MLISTTGLLNMRFRGKQASSVRDGENSSSIHSPLETTLSIVLVGWCWNIAFLLPRFRGKQVSSVRDKDLNTKHEEIPSTIQSLWRQHCQ